MNLSCPKCGATNRVPEDRVDDRPACGRCGEELLAARPAALDDSTFERFVGRTDLPVLVDFWAGWCGPCKAMAPHFEQAAARMPRVRFAKVDTDASPRASRANGIRSIPTLVLYVGGREVARQSGAMSSSDLLSWVKGRLADAR